MSLAAMNRTPHHQMNRFIAKLSLMISLLLLSQGVKAQFVLKQATEQYNLYNYTKAVQLYLQVYKKEPSFFIAEHLANSYRLMEDYQNAETWYATTTAMPEAKPEDFKNNSKYDEAKAQYTKYYAVSPDIDQKQLKVWVASCDSSIFWIKNPRYYDIINEQNLNSTQSDWGAVKYNNSIIFTSDRRDNTPKETTKGKALLRFDVDRPIDKIRYLWTGNSYLSLYQSELNGTASPAKAFHLTDGTDYHIGAASFTADGNEIWFTLTRIPEKLRKDTAAIKTIKLEVFWSRRIAATGQWSKPMPFKYNNAKYSVGDPFITPDGKTLYFASDMPGGMGGTDIYISTKDAIDNWSLPVNLKAVNTKGNERTPVLDGNNIYFSSDGRIGMGGLDIYKAVKRDSVFSAVQNMGYPLNSPQDDFAFMPTSPTTGYLSSNRPGGVGSDDIYSFVQKSAPTFAFEGTVYNKKTKQVIPNSTVTLTKVIGKTVSTQSDAAGRFTFTLAEKSNYKLHGEKTGYLSDNQTVTTLRANPAITIRKDLYLDKIELNKAIRLENIYYDFDQSYIREDAGDELDKLIKILKENPTIEIELGSHTDSRGNDAYNMALSQRRADEAVKYIVDIGDIDPHRIKAKGYGETRLLNRCKNGVGCSEEEHQLNRRTEFKITKM
jgi:peptidoglycan-associated lipoprotein